MAWIEGKLDRTFVINAPYEDVLAFFSNPDAFKEAYVGLEVCEDMGDGVWRWQLEEKTEKGITFQPNYQVKYTVISENEREWEPVEGNIRSTGRAVFKDLSGKTEIEYHEKMETDLPIPRLAAKIFGKIVGREVAAGVNDFLNNAKNLLESRA